MNQEQYLERSVRNLVEFYNAYRAPWFNDNSVPLFDDPGVGEFEKGLVKAGIILDDISMELYG